jgi:hypothetical protein
MSIALSRDPAQVGDASIRRQRSALALPCCPPCIAGEDTWAVHNVYTRRYQRAMDCRLPTE